MTPVAKAKTPKYLGADGMYRKPAAYVSYLFACAQRWERFAEHANRPNDTRYAQEAERVRAKAREIAAEHKIEIPK